MDRHQPAPPDSPGGWPSSSAARRWSGSRLHVNGTARVIGAGEANGGRPRVERWVEVRVREAYIHCRKHLPHLLKVTGEARPWVAE